MTTPSTRPLALGPLVIGGMILAAALTRLLPHPFPVPYNFSPIESMALFGGAYYAKRAWAVVTPLVAMLASDLALGLVHGGSYFNYFFDASFLPVYACIVLCTLLGLGLRGRATGLRVLGSSLLGSALFFLLTNFAVWATASADVSPICANGLGACYVAGLPFFQWTVLGTLFYAAILFGGFALLRARIPQLRAQTA